MKEIIDLYLEPTNTKTDFEIKDIIEDISNRITGLVGLDSDFEVKNLLEFKRTINNDLGENLFLGCSYDIFNKEQFNLMSTYQTERYYSALYGTPEFETEKEKIRLQIGEELTEILGLIQKIAFNNMK